MALHRPYIRQDVREEVERRAEKNEEGQFLDANTHEPIEGQYDLGHKAGHEHWREAEQAEKEGLSQDEFNDRMNNPDFYQIEDPHENRSHAHEMPANEQVEGQTEYLGSAAAPAQDAGSTENYMGSAATQTEETGSAESYLGSAAEASAEADSGPSADHSAEME